MDTKGYKWIYIKGDIDLLLGMGDINWEAEGFTIRGIRWATSRGYQIPLSTELHTLFPIENWELFEMVLLPAVEAEPEYYQILTQEEAIAKKEELTEILHSEQQAAQEKMMASVPSGYGIQTMSLDGESTENDPLMYMVSLLSKIVENTEAILAKMGDS